MWYCFLCCARWFELLHLWMKRLCEIIQMRACEHWLHELLFIMLCKVSLTSTSVDETLVCDHSNATELYFHFVVFGMIYHVVLT